MKKLMLLPVLFFLMVSCGKDSTSLESKKNELTELKKQIGQLQSQAKKLEAEIEALDTGTQRGIAVKVDTIVRKSYKNPFQVQGLVVSDEDVVISPEMGGQLKSILVKEGQNVQRGQLLATLDGSLVNAQISELEKALELAEIAYKRQKALWDQKIGTEIQYLQAKNNKESLERRLETARVQATKFQLRSPVSGVIDALFSNQGDMTGPGTPIMRVVSTRQVKIKADVSEQYISYLNKNDEVSVFFPSLKKGSTEKIQAVGSYINPNNRTFSIYISPSQSTLSQLKPNMLALITAYDFSKDNALSVATRLVRNDSEGSYVLVAEKGQNGNYTVQKKYVEIEESFATETILLGGIEEGSLIITEGFQKVIPGDRVEIIR